METVGVIGLGTMGKGLALRLAERGYRVLGWNRTPLYDPQEMAQVHIVSQLTAITAEASVIILSLADYHAAYDLITRLDLASAPQGRTILQFGTISPQQVHQLRELVVSASPAHALLDVGMLGNHMHARNGELRLFVGGETEAYQRVQDLLAAMSKQITCVGDLGMGMVAKLALNLLMGIEMEALAEAVLFGERYGLDRKVLIEALASSGFSSPVMSFKARRMSAQTYGRPDFRLALMHKDLKLFSEACAARGIAAPAAEGSLEVLQAAQDQGLGEQDCVAIEIALSTLKHEVKQR
ncbi:MAG TPA: NAD(P)-dependent oxidoreductase [Ktedonobacteraceae bacterium]|nr:NAD(P)-dependent oxidoreductase [Ktedonobacteraceae bacterium]